MKRRLVAGGLEVSVPLALFGIWWLCSTRSASFFFPPLPDILTMFVDTWLFERVGSDVVPSLVRLGSGFAIAVAAGIAGGMLLGLSHSTRGAAGPVLEFLRAVPAPALIPPAILVLGVGDAMKLFIIAVGCVWPILLNAIDGAAGVDRTLVDTARSYGIGRLDRLRSVILPAALPQIFAGMRTSLSLALILMVVSEMMASTNGIGFFILQSQRSFAIPEMWSGILLLGLLGYALNFGLTVVERRVIGWHRSAHASALERT